MKFLVSGKSILISKKIQWLHIPLSASHARMIPARVFFPEIDALVLYKKIYLQVGHPLAASFNYPFNWVNFHVMEANRAPEIVRSESP